MRQRLTVNRTCVAYGDAHAGSSVVGSPVSSCHSGNGGACLRTTLSTSTALSDLPDWRITCFFVDRGRRHRGVSSAALGGALDEIDRLGGGMVESYPDAVDGRSVSGSFLHNGTLALFERHGFERTGRIGKTRWVVRKTVG
jgi:hypothetical protein